MTCKCNCHDEQFRYDTDTPEHANHEECRKALDEENDWFAKTERWYGDFIVSGGQRPFRSAK